MGKRVQFSTEESRCDAVAHPIAEQG